MPQWEYPMAGSGDPDFFRSILENLHMAVYVVGPNGKILSWNDGAERITGYLRQDVIGRVCGDNFLGEIDGDENDLSGVESQCRRRSNW
jgi:PAS domain S-box-containing protein